MFLVLTRWQLMRFCGIIGLICIFCYSLTLIWVSPCQNELLSNNDILNMVNQTFHLRNQALLENNLSALDLLYNRNTLYGIWAYEHQVKKMKYLHQWCFKQGVELKAIKSLVRIRRAEPRRDGVRVTLLASTEYHYSYIGAPGIDNFMRIGTYHSLDLCQKGDFWQIGREWYADPFADTLRMSNEEAKADRAFMLSQKHRDFSELNPRRLSAVAYAEKYCGAAADDEVGFKYNPKYRNYNYSGGDCANFVSQVLHEGGGFRKTLAWNYGRGASRAWVNAHSFNIYMLSSGRASRIAYGSYRRVFKSSFNLLPGDYVAYEKKGKVTHVSVVTGFDSKGYALTNSHNTDRYRVAWDLGYGDKGIRFWLVRVHY